MSITAMKKAREGLKAARHGHCDHAWADEAIADLSAAIEAAEKQEAAERYIHEYRSKPHPGDFGIPRGHWWQAKQYADVLYTTPPAAQPAQPAQQEPVAWAVFEGRNAHDLYLPQEYDEALKMAGYKGDHAEVKPLYTTPPAAQQAPLTDEQRQELMSKAWNKWLSGKDDGRLFAWYFSFEVEATHGITGEKT
jgi:hypothetical protein